MTEWKKYKHRYQKTFDHNIEYEVECEEGWGPKTYETEPHGEICYRVRTLRNLLLKRLGMEEVHQTAYTFMPIECFHKAYKQA